MPTPSRRRGRTPEVLYSRELPGGGYVTIQFETLDDSTVRGWISVERRAERRRRDTVAVPAICETAGPDRDSVYNPLHEIASDNVALARHLRRWENDG